MEIVSKIGQGLSLQERGNHCRRSVPLISECALHSHLQRQNCATEVPLNCKAQGTSAQTTAKRGSTNAGRRGACHHLLYRNPPSMI